MNSPFYANLHMMNLRVESIYNDVEVRGMIKELYTATDEPFDKGLNGFEYWGGKILHHFFDLLGHRGLKIKIEINQSEESSSSTANKAG